MMIYILKQEAPAEDEVEQQDQREEGGPIVCFGEEPEVVSPQRPCFGEDPEVVSPQRPSPKAPTSKEVR